jgi:alpha-glucosidase
MLAAFSPFYRNHNEIKMIPQEFYRWESVAEAARKAIEIRYKLLDYFYTAFYQQTKTGLPALNPMFYLYPNDKETFGIDLQFFYGPAILVSPVTEENSTSVDIYLPDDIFYDYHTGAPVRGEGKSITLNDVEVTDIPLHIRGGNIVIQRTEGDMTTTGLREKPFEIIIAPDLNGKASGSLYLDDGDSIEQPATSEIEFGYEDSVFKMTGKFDFKVADSVKIVSLTVLGQDEEPTSEGPMELDFDAKSKTVTAKVDLPLTGPAEVKF